MSDFPTPDVKASGKRRGLFARISLIWIVPLLALAVAVGVAWQNYAGRGALITITFQNAAGIKAGETELRYRDVAVGQVEAVNFSDGLERVEVDVRLNREVEPYVDSSASFWVVRPEVSTRGVSGLGTVLSGVYIEGSWDNQAGGLQDSPFEGATDAPLNSEGRPGVRIRLRAAADAGLSGNSPIEYRGVRVGMMGNPEVTDEGTVEADAIIYLPHDKLITSTTRFWDTSGFRFSIGTGGAEVDFSSVAALLSGGVTFSTMVSGGQPLDAGDTFAVFPDESAARNAAFEQDSTGGITFNAVFDENIPGLADDAPVTYGGLRVGKVDSVRGLVDPARFGDDTVRLGVTFRVFPTRLGLVATPGEEHPTGQESALDAPTFFNRQVADEGLRARLATDSILTGGLKIELVRLPDAAQADFAMESEPAQDSPPPEFPTAPGNIRDISSTAEGVFSKISSLPFDALMQSAINTMNNVSALLGNDDIRAVPADVRALLGEARGILGQDAVQSLPDQLSEITTEVGTLLTALNTQRAAERLLDAVDDVAGVAQSVSSSVEGVPQLIARLDGIAAQAEDLPLDDLARSLEGLLQSADALLAEEGTRALPASLGRTLDALRDVLTDLRDGGTVENLNQTMASAREAAQRVAEASEGLPALLDRAQGVLNQAGSTLQGYDANSGVGRQLEQTLRDINRAAAAITALARELERNPNSLLFGR